MHLDSLVTASQHGCPALRGVLGVAWSHPHPPDPEPGVRQTLREQRGATPVCREPEEDDDRRDDNGQDVTSVCARCVRATVGESDAETMS